MRGYRFIPIILLILFPVLVQGQTYVSGGIGNATWTAAGSPYIVIGNTYAMDLTIDAGVTVQFDEFCVLEVDFSLIVNGTESDSVYFTAGDTCWQSIDLTSGPASISRITYANFEGAGRCDLGVLNGGDGNLSLRHCTFRNNDAEYVLKYHGEGFVTESKLMIDNCCFYDNTADYVLYSRYHDYAIIKDSHFFNNTTLKVIHFDYYSYAQSACGYLMYGCTLYNNSTVYSGMTFSRGVVAFSVFIIQSPPVITFST
ncbi:hypothetical protein CEE37_13310 [candidate division LCP-89 bacterium B3_LCP]|uniref:Right handed beta helix domain-containing protein n=1 Tax=candidate division LCP-89 bacterium B3_LCP TaxID=2012998 RepID=A0A532USZ6_UNCL8|nr:MAG: hypothetical protein CEE37_13310 [candidate division LCP-89 bacterium B3_LCP]